MTESILRRNLLNERGYTPYCGAEKCYVRWPRTRFNGQQFQCMCGWQSSLEPEFIAQYADAQYRLTFGVLASDGEQR